MQQMLQGDLSVQIHDGTREVNAQEPSIKETHLLVLVHIDPLQLAESNKVSAHQDPQLLPLLLSLLSVSTVTLMLHPDP